MRKDLIALRVYTYKDISHSEYANKLASFCKEAGLSWEKIDNKEPLRQTYSDDLLYELWATRKRTGRPGFTPVEYGGVMCSQKRATISLSANWRCVDPPRYSTIDIFISPKEFKSRRTEMEELLIRLIDLTEADFACICNFNFWRNSRGTYFKKVPLHQDVHWLTYFSRKRMKEMLCPVDKLSWYRCIDLSQGTLCQICEHVPKDGDSIEAECLKYRTELWGVNVSWEIDGF